MKKITKRIQRNGQLNDVYFEDVKGPGGGYHYYEVYKAGEIPGTHKPIAVFQFQQGPRKEEGSIHGLTEQDLWEINRHRLQAWQEGDYRTRENACALTHTEEALMWSAKRAEDRLEDGKLGTMKI